MIKSSRVVGIWSSTSVNSEEVHKEIEEQETIYSLTALEERDYGFDSLVK